MSNVRKCNEKNTVVILGTPYKDPKRADFRCHVGSLFRFTYRKDFTALHPYPISSDAGWGCMLRSAQMMMACALQRHLLGKDWRRSDNINILRASTQYCDILRWFSDYPGAPHMYSIHHLVQCGMRYDKLPGEWFGPSTAALVLRDLTRLHRSKYGGTLEVLVTQGDTIYIRDCEDLCTSTSTADKKDVGNAAKGNNKNNHADNGHHISNSRTFGGGGGGDVRSSRDSAEGVLLNSVSEDDTMFSNGNDAYNTSVAADFVRSSSAYNKSYPDNANSNHSNNSSIKSIGHKEKVIAVSVTNQPEGSSQPLFDPLFNPPPSHTAPWGCSLVVCIPLRLGISSVSSEYIEVRNHKIVLSLEH
jgi:Peptidase family C54